MSINRARDKTSSAGKYILGGVIATGLWIAAYMGNELPNIENGILQGQIVSYAERGIFWKTHEATIALGGTNRSLNINFSLDGQRRHGENLEELAEQLKSSLQTGDAINVHVRSPAYSWQCRSDTKSHAYQIEKREN